MGQAGRGRRLRRAIGLASPASGKRQFGDVFCKPDRNDVFRRIVDSMGVSSPNIGGIAMNFAQ
jgi:hypothetical protein